MEAFLAHREAQGLTRSTLDADRRILGILAAWTRWRGLDVRTLTRAPLMAFLDAYRQAPIRSGARAGQKRRPSTLVGVIRSLKAWFRYLADKGQILLDPMETIRVTPDRPICGLGVFNPHEMERIFQALEGDHRLILRDRALAAVLYGVGLRVGEASRLDLAHYNPDEQILWVRQGKGRKDRCLPVSASTSDDLDRYLQKGRPALANKGGPPAIFLNKMGTRLGIGGMILRLKQAQKRAGIARCRGAHAFRHSFATHLLARGASSAHLQRFLGHASIETTARYAAVSLEDLRDVVEKIHPRERGADE